MTRRRLDRNFFFFVNLSLISPVYIIEIGKTDTTEREGGLQMPQEDPFVTRYWKLLLHLDPDGLRKKQTLASILNEITGAPPLAPAGAAAVPGGHATSNIPPLGGSRKQVNE